MNDAEIMQKAIEDFSRVQEWMLLSGKDSEAFQSMYKRYVELKVLLSSLGVNLTKLDKING